jgi:hypothetical protein
VDESTAPRGLSDPAAVDTLAELGAALEVLRRGRSYGELDRAARRLPPEHGGSQRLPSSTVSDLLKGRTSQRTLETFLATCSVPRTEVVGWVQAWERARAVHSDRPAGAVRVREANPRLLGVHAAIDVEGALGVLPTYVMRDADLDPHGVRSRLVAAAECGGFVLLVGSSSAGKTRSAYEAITALLADWWLVHPANPAEIRTLAQAPARHTVIWLDEIQRYVDRADGLDGPTVRSLQRGPQPVVLIGTLWPDRYAAYTTVPLPGRPDVMGLQRELLGLAEVVHLEGSFSRAEMARARELAATDPRIRIAVDSADYGLTQVIAAAPQLVSRWENADPYARAVLSAAVDAARLGFRSVLSAEMLRSAAPGYCDLRVRAGAQPNWFERALAYTTQLLHGATAALIPVASGDIGMGQVSGYAVADFLLQHLAGRRRAVRPPAALWEACLHHVADPADILRLADSAHSRLLYCYAEPLFQRAVELSAQDPMTGDLKRPAAWRLAHLLFEQGRIDDLRVRAEAGDTNAACFAANGLAEQGQIEDAVAMLRAHGDTTHVHGLWSIVEWLIDPDERLQDAMAILRVFTGEGDLYPIRRLADLLARCGEVEELRDLASTYESAAWQLAKLLAQRGETEELRVRAEQGDFSATWWLTEMRTGHHPGAELRLLLDSASPNAAARYADLLAEHGEVEELRARADAGNTYMASRLADLLAQRGELEELRTRAEYDMDAVARLAELFVARGEAQELRDLDDTGGHRADIASAQLAELLVKQGNEDELRARMDAGDLNASVELPNLLNEHGRAEEACRLRRFGLTADGSLAHGTCDSSENRQHRARQLRPTPARPWCSS